jgi:hypothetical protein
MSYSVKKTHEPPFAMKCYTEIHEALHKKLVSLLFKCLDIIKAQRMNCKRKAE